MIVSPTSGGAAVVLVATGLLLLLTIASGVPSVGAGSPSHNQDDDERQDPHWRVGQWGHFGPTATRGMYQAAMSSWAHRDMRDRKDDDANKDDRAAPRHADLLAEPSPLTDSGVPPIVVHIPMNAEELSDYERMLRREATLRMETNGAADSTPIEDVAPSQHPLPPDYVRRVRTAAADSGFDWMGLAVPSLFADRHVFHASVESTQRFLVEHHTQRDGRSIEHVLASELLPPKRRGFAHTPPGTTGHRDHDTIIVEHTHGLKYQEAMGSSDPVDSNSDFARAIRKRNELHTEHREWKDAWKRWSAQHSRSSRSGRSELDHGGARRALGESLEKALADSIHITEVLPQKPQPRVLRVGSMPTMWQTYREPHDLEHQDPRPARDFTRGPAGEVSDPMLTEQWSMYDAELWGDIPAGPAVHRPSLWAGPYVWDDLGLEGRGISIGVVDSGIELTHPELVHRYARAVSYDALNPSRNRPPTPVDAWHEIHGTAAAGVALAERGNGVCGAGVAPQSHLGAIRLLGTRSPTDSEEASALSHACRPHGTDPAHNQLINSVYSNSWGPIDDGADLRGPGAVASAAIDACVHQHGRHGKGTVYVWAGGNGRAQGDNANYDGYANRPETIAVGAIDDTGYQAWYSEPGACLMLVAPSSGGASGVVTSDPSGPMGYSAGRCTRIFGGTSAAAPAVAGVVALILEIAPDLGWRDVQHVLIRSSQRIIPNDKREPWSRNDAGLWHSHGYGFGLLNATRAVLEASAWRPLDPREALVAKSPVMRASDTLYEGGSKKRRWEVESFIDIDDDDGDLDSSEPEFEEGVAIDTAGRHPRHAVVYDEEVVDEPVEGQEPEEPEDAAMKHSKRVEGVLRSMFLFLPRYAFRKGKHFRDAVVDMARDEREARRYARRERAPNEVRVAEKGSSSSVFIPPGHTAEFRWHWPAPTGESNDPFGIRSMEHVGLRVDMNTPAGRGMIRIWLCAPSGTCSLMAPAPHDQDRHTRISGRDWVYWTVRNWGEPPIFGADHTGHGRGTWGLILVHVESPSRHRRHQTNKERRYHPRNVDAMLNWWQLEVRGSRQPAPAILPYMV